MDHVVSFRADRVVYAHDSGDLIIDRHDQGGLAECIKLAEHRLGRGIERNPSLCQEPTVADQHGVIQLASGRPTAPHARAGQNGDVAWLAKSLRAASGLIHDHVGQGMAAR